MSEIVVDPTATRIWPSLQQSAERIKATTLMQLFGEDPGRSDTLTFEAAGYVVDISKNLIDEAVLNQLVELARELGIERQRDAMFAGEIINTSEQRRVLHTALRAPRGSSLMVNGSDVVAEIQSVLDQMGRFADQVRSGFWRGSTGKVITDVVNIGIGGSHLGPLLAGEALRRTVSAPLTVHFIANIDGADFDAETAPLNPETTLFVVSSKSFTTAETMMNASLAKAWIVQALGRDAVSKHFVGVSGEPAAVANFGIDPDNTFAMWDFVGGRYSLGSAIGLSTMLLIGRDAFTEMLAGFRDIDEHFTTTPLERNVPVLLGLLRIWYSCFLGAQSLGIMPYAADLRSLPGYLQQLVMESNGKRVSRDGRALSTPSGPIVWGAPGTDGQHSFFQLLHQGTHLAPMDLIGYLHPLSSHRESHDQLMANLFAQSQALAFGRSAEQLIAEGTPPELVAHRVVPGNHPSTLILGERLNPRSFGALIGLYEHDVFVQGALLGIDSFDQWGVELGKDLATVITAEVQGVKPVGDHDPSTGRAIERYRAARRDWAK
jgi:glucose-6-phosphate isomerase